MKRIITLLILLALPAIAMSQAATRIDAPAVPVDDGLTAKGDSIWQYGGASGLTLSQTALSHWSGGGANSVAFNAFFNYGADYKKDNHIWKNRLELAYGATFTRLAGLAKATDKIYLASLYGYGLGHNWYASALLNFNTQFANGFTRTATSKTRISRFMAPGYLTIGAGFTWEPKKWFNLTISPATWRATWVLDESLYHSPAGQELNPFGVKYRRKNGAINSSHMRNEFGANVRAEINYDITKDLNIYTRLTLFSNYLEKPQNVDVTWDIIFTAKVNKWLSANLTVNMIYDDDIHIITADGFDGGPRFQVKEVLGIGLQAAF